MRQNGVGWLVLQGAAPVLEREVRRWLDAEWPFETVRWPGRDLSWEDWNRLPDA